MSQASKHIRRCAGCELEQVHEHDIRPGDYIEVYRPKLGPVGFAVWTEVFAGKFGACNEFGNYRTVSVDEVIDHATGLAIMAGSKAQKIRHLTNH